MLTTLLNPTAGTATVAGVDLLRDPTEVRRRIGYVAQGGGPRCRRCCASWTLPTCRWRR